MEAEATRGRRYFSSIVRGDCYAALPSTVAEKNGRISLSCSVGVVYKSSTSASDLLDNKPALPMQPNRSRAPTSKRAEAVWNGGYWGLPLRVRRRLASLHIAQSTVQYSMTKDGWYMYVQPDRRTNQPLSRTLQFAEIAHGGTDLHSSTKLLSAADCIVDVFISSTFFHQRIPPLPRSIICPMAPSRLTFVPGLSVSLTRPHPLPPSRPALTPLHPPRRRAARRGPVASAELNASQAADAVAAEVGSTPDVAFGALAPPLRALLATVTIAAASAFSFTAAPPRGVARPGAAVAGAAVAVVGVAQLRKGPRKAARKHLARLLVSPGLSSPELPALVQGLKGKFGVSEEDVSDMCQTMYEMYLLAMVDRPLVSFGEISQLARLKAALGLSGPAVGDAHFETCRAFYRNNVVYLDAEDDDVERDTAQRKLDKLIFLSDRMYSDKDTEEAYLYEQSRLFKFFAMSKDMYDEKVARVALPFYKNVVARACVDTSVTSEDVRAAQATLGVSDVQAERIRADAYADRVDSLVSQKGKLDEVDNESLVRLRALLNIEDDRATSTLKTLAEPVYRVEVGDALDAVKKGEESLASIYGRLALRQSELSFPTDAARASMSKEMSERAVDIIRSASKYLRVQNVNGCISQLKELLVFTDGIIGLLKVSNDDIKDDVAIVNSYLPNVASNLSRMEPRQMYRIFLSQCLEKRQISPEEEVELTRLRALLGLTEVDALEAFKSAAGPVYKKAISDAVTAGAFDDERKATIIKLKEDLSLPIETSKSIDLDLYRSKLTKLVDGNRILQEHEAQELFVLREFLGLTREDTAPVHKSCMGPVYEQSVTEAMGPTGIMLDEYRDGLKRLQDRLGLTKEDADDAFYRVVKQRMLLYVSRAMAQLEKRQTFRGQNEERDVGDDPEIKRAGAVLGIDAGGLPIELSNLVDFYVRNGLVKEEEVEIEGEKKTITKYPISLRAELQPKVYNELYKQYVIQCFSAQTRGEKQRLFSALDQLGSILGLQEDEISKIHSEIGTVIYNNYVNQALLKGPIEEKDSEFLSNIQKMLSMKEDHCASLLKNAKENRVSVLLERIFSQPKVLPETVKKMRAVASSLDVDLVKDLKVSAEQRGKLFSVEIDAAIDTGALSADNQSLVQEVQQTLQVEDEEAKNILLGCIQRRTLSHLVQASASLRQDRTEAAILELKTMLRYGKLLPAKVNAPAVSVSEKRELYLLFQADVITDGVVDEKAKDQVNLLKTLFGFVDADLELVS